MIETKVENVDATPAAIIGHDDSLSLPDDPLPLPLLIKC